MRIHSAIKILPAIILISTAPAGAVANLLPAAVTSNSSSSLEPVGSGVYHKLGFTIYNATLWAPDGTWDENKPYALQLKYKRNLSKETLVDSVMDSIREQNVADESKLQEWQQTLTQVLPDVSKNDEIVGVSKGNYSQLYYNGKRIAGIKDPVLSNAFFNIWLGETADPKLRSELLSQNQPQNN